MAKKEDITKKTKPSVTKKTTARGLGRGLNALLGTDAITSATDMVLEQVKSVRINDLSPNQEQPRQDFDQERLQELAESIRENGIVQPLLVTANPDGQGYIIVAGERRWRAARMADLKEVPVIVRQLSAKEIQRIALIENINREDLNQIEEAQALQKLLDEFGMTQEELAVDIGRSRSAVTNTLRLLRLPRKIQDFVRIGDLSAGHARALLALETEEAQLSLAERTIQNGLSVREVERAVQRLLLPRPSKKKVNEAEMLSIKSTEEKLSKILGTKVRFTYDNGRGSITIRYKTLDELQRLLEVLGAES